MQETVLTVTPESLRSSQRHRRLQTVSIALQPCSALGTFAEQEDPDTALALEHPLAQRADGQVEVFEFDQLRQREAEAVRRRQYRLAAQLRDLQECFNPRNQLTLDECCPPTAEAQYQFFLRKGVRLVAPHPEPALADSFDTASDCVNAYFFSLWSSLT